MSGDAGRGYRLAARISAEHGRTYHLAASLLPRRSRHAVHALYGFARTADDIVDRPPAPDADDRVERLDDLFDGLRTALRGDDAEVAHDTADLLAAVTDTIRAFDIDIGYFADFERSMRMDLPSAPQYTDRYRDMAHLRQYTRGSAAVIGLMLVRVLRADPGNTDIADGAALLGEAFQLTNFLRDVGEDLDRDRIYLPADALAAFGVDEEHLRACRAGRAVSPELRRALAHLAAVNRDWYRRATPAIEALPRRTRPAIRAAAYSYSGILDVLAASGYEVFADRAVVAVRTRIRHALGATLPGGVRRVSNGTTIQ